MTIPESSPRSLAVVTVPAGLVTGAVVLTTLAYLWTLLPLAAAQALIFGALTQLAFALPGVLIVRMIAGQTAGWLAPATLGPLLGIALSSVVLLVFWAAGVRSGWTLLVLAPALAAGLAWPAKRLAGRWQLPTTVPADVVALLLLLLVVPIVVGRPFSLVGAELPDGQAYRAYFTADFVWQRAVVAELAKGDFLPLNPFFTGDILHYYWLPHLMSAVEYRTVGQALGLDHLLLMRSVLVDAGFVAFLYGFARLFVSRPWAAALGTACALLFTSFEGLYALLEYWRLGVPLTLVRYLNIDAVSRWVLQGMPIDGLHRILLYQPHHALGYAVGLFGLLAIARRTRRDNASVVAVGGGLLGLSILISSFGGLMLTLTAALFEAVSVARWREWRRAVRHAVAAALPLGIAVALAVLLQYVDRSGSIISLGLNPTAVYRVLPATALSFGPALLLAGAGGWVACRRRQGEMAVFGALVLVCIVFYFYVDVRDHQHVYVGWRVGHLLFITAAPLVALLFDALVPLPPPRRAAGFAVVGLVVIGAAPTVAIDLYNTQDVYNRAMFAGGHFTLVLTNDELAALEWIKDNTSPSAIFQVDPIARDAETWAYLPAFAERRMAGGLPISMTPLEKYERRSRQLRWLFEASDPKDTWQLADTMGIDYLVVGPPERQAHPGLEERLGAAWPILPRVFRNDTIAIYRVQPLKRALMSKRTP